MFFRYGSWYKEDAIDVPQKPSQTAAAAAGAAAWQTPSPDDLSGITAYNSLQTPSPDDLSGITAYNSLQTPSPNDLSGITACKLFLIDTCRSVI